MEHRMHHRHARTVVNFDRLSNATVRDYLKRFSIPGSREMGPDQLRAVAARHFANTPAEEFLPITAEHTVQRFCGFLSRQRMRIHNSRKRARSAVTVKPRSAYPSLQAYSAALAAAATLPASKHNNPESYCVVGCRHKGSSKSGGTMIACDGDSHDEKWYHLACVGLDQEPTGKWYCFACEAEQTLAKKARMAAAGGYGSAAVLGIRPSTSSNSSASSSPTSTSGASRTSPKASSSSKKSKLKSSSASSSSSSSSLSGKPPATSKAAHIAFVKAALKAIAAKKKRSVPEGTLKEITAMVEAKFRNRLDVRLENDARRTPVWKAQIHKILRSSKTGFTKTKRGGQCYYGLQSQPSTQTPAQ